REANQGQVKQNPQYPRQGQEYGFRENISAQRRQNLKHFFQEGQYQNNSGKKDRISNQTYVNVKIIELAKAKMG
ncbi:unnamed protein product, partial [Ceratitis capitata]